jgi:cytochrome c556
MASETRFVVGVAVLMMAWSGATGIAQTKIATGEEHEKVMRSTAQAFGGLTTAVAAGGLADAKARLATAREGFVALEGFWAEKKRDDAVGIVKGVLTQLDAFDKLLAAETVSRSAMLGVTKRVQGACAACHALYREGDNQTGFRFRAGVL